MRLLLQRVKWAKVQVRGKEVACIDPGLLILAGFAVQDQEGLSETQAWSKILNKIPGLRIFPDQQGRSNLDLEDIQGQILLIPQFTLFADCRKGRRPSFTRAAPAGLASQLQQKLYQDLASRLPDRVQQGIFGAEMDLSYCNWGPMSIILDSEDFQ
ncbi:MAG: D-aminoacyl-tRNA deacylase [Desulfohalobiaceae bacterium]